MPQLLNCGTSGTLLTVSGQICLLRGNKVSLTCRNNVNMEHKQISDDELLAKIKNDDYQAFDILFRRYYTRLNAFTYRFVNDNNLAKDIVQEVFIKLWEKRSQIKIISIEALLFKMVRNQCLNYIRHIKLMENKELNLKEATQLEELYRIDIIKDEPYLLIEKELENEILEVMGNLPEKCREVFRLSRIDGLMNKEIAEKLGFSVKNVEKHISKAIKHFKSHFADRIPIQIIIFVLLHHYEKI